MHARLAGLVCVLLLFLEGAHARRLSEDASCAVGDVCCHYINGNASWSHVADKCGCTERSDCESDGVIPYMKWHYCGMGCVPALSIFFCGCWILFLFSLALFSPWHRR